MNELDIGKAGEYLVCFDLTTKGYNCFPSEQGLPFDVVLVKDSKLIKVQVKTCLKSKILFTNNVCIFGITHGKNKNKKTYSSNDVDIFAFVNIETKEIAYLKAEDCKSIIHIYPHFEKGNTSNEILEKKMNLALLEIQKNSKIDLELLASKYELSIHTLRRYKNKKTYSNSKKVSFFSDFDIEDCF